MPLRKCLNRFSFGIRGDVHKGVIFIDEHKLIYVSGNNIVDYNMDDRQQRFYPSCENAIGITAISVSSKKLYITQSDLTWQLQRK